VKPKINKTLSINYSLKDISFAVFTLLKSSYRDDIHALNRLRNKAATFNIYLKLSSKFLLIIRINVRKWSMSA
jgi:hypothetical protein